MSCNNVGVTQGKEGKKLHDNVVVADLNADTTIITSLSDVGVSLYYIDSLHYGHPVFERQKKYTLNISVPTWIIEADENQTPFLIYPSESLELKKEKSKPMQLTLKENEKRNNELSFFSAIIKVAGGFREGFVLKKYQGKVNGIKQFYAYKDTIQYKNEIRNTFLNEYTKNFSVSQDFISRAKSIIARTALKDFLLLCNNNKDLLLKNNLFDHYMDSSIAGINNDTGNTDFVYGDLCIIAANIMMKAKYYNEIDITGFSGLESSFVAIQKFFIGNARNYLLSAYMFRALNKGIPVTDKLMKAYKLDCGDVNYKQYIVQKSISNNKVESFKYANLIQNKSGNYFDLDSVIMQNKDSIILLDFWASWCAPCRTEMEHSRRLREKYVNKPVKFIYLSIDKNINDWKEAMKEERLESNNSFLLENAENSGFYKNYKINSIPRYMLIGAQGKIINADAPRPGDKEIELLIDRNLFSIKVK